MYFALYKDIFMRCRAKDMFIINENTSIFYAETIEIAREYKYWQADIKGTILKIR
jgi:hypothetical protein